MCDLKVVIALSSVFHMVFRACGVLLRRHVREWAGIFMLVGHGLVSAGLFYVGRVIYNKVGTRSLPLIQGTIKTASKVRLV
jgi:NADH-quinone oxidoreductase subunit M